MNFRLANINDLPNIKIMYEKIIDDMNRNNIAIWDEIFPCEFFATDIESSLLYLLEERDAIVAAFALSESSKWDSSMEWENMLDKALYISKFGINVDYSGRGIGSMMLKHAMAITKEKDVRYLRLFVVGINKPAINLYLKNGFRQVAGIHEEKIDDDLTLSEYGFEIAVPN